MVNCPKCGAEVKEEDNFCINCGASLAPEVMKTARDESRYSRERDACFGERERERDLSGLVSFGMFLLIVGSVFLVNPNIISDFQLWIEQMINEQGLVRPTGGLINSATIFFGLIGLSNFFTAGIRLLVYKARRRALTDILSGVALTLFAYLIYLYGGDVLTWQVVLAIEAVVVGLLVILYSIVRYMFLK